MSKALIYIVEDDPALGNLLLEILKLEGYERTTLFSDGKECLNKLANKPDLVILDFSLETYNGLDVLKFIKSKQPRTKVVIYSSLASDTELMQKCKDNGALACFDKNDEGREELVKWMSKNLNKSILNIFK